jgi:hypothetical protein
MPKGTSRCAEVRGASSGYMNSLSPQASLNTSTPRFTSAHLALALAITPMKIAHVTVTLCLHTTVYGMTGLRFYACQRVASLPFANDSLETSA